MIPDANVPNAFSQQAVEQEINVVPMNFRVEFVPKEGTTELREIHKVDLVKKGSNGESTPWNINALKQEQFIWPHVEKYYEYWLQGQEDPVEGTPLDVLPFIPKAIIQHLKNLHIKTAEDLAGATDADLERIGMGGRGWREKARTFLEAKESTAKISEANVELEKNLANALKEIEELKTQVNSLTPKRGRPKKDAE